MELFYRTSDEQPRTDRNLQKMFPFCAPLYASPPKDELSFIPVRPLLPISEVPCASPADIPLKLMECRRYATHAPPFQRGKPDCSPAPSGESSEE